MEGKHEFEFIIKSWSVRVMVFNTTFNNISVISWSVRLTPERAPRTVLRYERPENLGFYACIVTTNIGSFNFVIENFFWKCFPMATIIMQSFDGISTIYQMDLLLRDL
jgi:hypothetical protein